METVVAVVRKWGNSNGVVLPRSLNVQPGEKLLLNVQRTKGFATVRDIFGKLKTGVITAEALKKVDEELDVEWK